MLHHRNHSEELNIALQLNLLFILRKNILLKFFSFFLLFFLQRVLKNLLIFQIFFLKELSSFSASPHITNGVSFIFVLQLKNIFCGLLSAYSRDIDIVCSKTISYLNVFTAKFNTMYYPAVKIIMEHKLFDLKWKLSLRVN